MNPKIKEIMLRTGAHKFISSGCQSRVEFVAIETVKECLEIIEKNCHSNETTYAINLIKEHFKMSDI